MIELLVSAFDVDMSYLVVRFKTLVEPNWGNLERFFTRLLSSRAFEMIFNHPIRIYGNKI